MQRPDQPQRPQRLHELLAGPAAVVPVRGLEHDRQPGPADDDEVEDVPAYSPSVRRAFRRTPPLPSVGVSIVMERERRQNNRTLGNGCSSRPGGRR